MALVPPGMANANVGVFEANRPIIEFEVSPNVPLPNFADGLIEYKVIPPRGPPAGEPLPRWDVYIDVFLNSDRLLLDTSPLMWAFAASTAAADGTVVPRPVLVPGQDRAGSVLWDMTEFSFGEGVAGYMVSPTPFITNGNPPTGYSIFLAINRQPGDNVTYTLSKVDVTRRDIS